MRNKILLFVLGVVSLPSFYSFSALQFYIGGGVVSSSSGFKITDSTTGKTEELTLNGVAVASMNTTLMTMDRPISTNPLQSHFVNGEVFLGLNWNFDGFLVGAELIGHSFNAKHAINGFAHDSSVSLFNSTLKDDVLVDSIPSRLSVTLKTKAAVDLALRLGYQLSESVRLFVKGGVGAAFSTLHAHQQYDKQTSAGNNDVEVTNPYRVIAKSLRNKINQIYNSDTTDAKDVAAGVFSGLVGAPGIDIYDDLPQNTNKFFLNLKFAENFRDFGDKDHYGLNIELDSASKIMWTWNCGADIEFALGNAGIRLGWMMTHALKKLETETKVITFKLPDAATLAASIAEDEVNNPLSYIYGTKMTYNAAGNYTTGAGTDDYLTEEKVKPAVEAAIKQCYPEGGKLGTYSPKFSLLSPSQHSISLSVFYTF